MGRVIEAWLNRKRWKKRVEAESEPGSLLRYIVPTGYETRTSGTHTRFCVKRGCVSVHRPCT